MSLMIHNEFEGYLITTDKSLMKVDQIHRWLSDESYWNKGIAFETVKKAFDHSFCIGILRGSEQVGYARLITDYAVIGYLADVYITKEHRRKGLSKAMLRILFDIDWVQQLRVIKLSTTDCHELYRPFGFNEPSRPELAMEWRRT